MTTTNKARTGVKLPSAASILEELERKQAALLEEAEEAKKAALEAEYPYIGVVNISSTAGDLNKTMPTLGMGLIYGKLVRVIKGGDLSFALAGGGIETIAASEFVNGPAFAIQLTPQEARELAVTASRMWNDGRPGTKSLSVEVRFSSSVEINTEGTVIAKVLLGSIGAAIGGQISSKDELMERIREKKAVNTQYRAEGRAKRQADRASSRGIAPATTPLTPSDPFSTGVTPSTEGEGFTIYGANGKPLNKVSHLGDITI